ncbi:hypothetical protein CERSUDRAFT_111802 [Gelatoporia subvermispora B]|uniref:SWI/SNF and RSC complexes subunit Ssr4 N-terminal domain-containing protein n=1 Tax=Ceriporiopsis subvermispora (strain B) TaxID=914234 RepID=M2PS81_CERS8|nr:hypothetical protein CERSUDRAFT_111802 [Gelatoporia subvermispora B]
MPPLAQLQQDGLCLQYPENLPLHATLSQEMALSMLLRATQLAQHTPFVWRYIDKPADGQLFLIFAMPSAPFPADGIRYQDQEQRYVLPAASGRELEVLEVRHGFIPGSPDPAAYRARRRYRLSKGGHPQLVLIHYSRGQAIPIIPAMNTPVRSYPLMPHDEPPVFVMGPKMGQKAYPNAGGAGPIPIPPQDRQPPMQPPIGMGGGMGPGAGATPQALLAAQNHNMEALERRSRERSGSMGTRQPQTRVIEEEDDADETDLISTRSLALARYRRNHEFMNEVFMYAAFGKQHPLPERPPPYSIFKQSDLDDKVAKLTAEVEELKAKSASRRAARETAEAVEAADVSMESLGTTLSEDVLAT